MRKRSAIIVLVCVYSVLAGAADAAGKANPAKSTSGRAARQETVRSLPFSKMSPNVRRKLDPILKSPSIYRRLPVQVVPCDKDLYVFLLRYPEVIVNMWELMGATKVSINRTGAYTMAASDGAGTDCNLELIYGTRNLHIYYAEGTYQGPVLRRKIKGRCVLVVTSGYSGKGKGDLVSHRLDVFLQIDNIGAELLAKTLHPLVGKSADHNFAETSKFFGQVSRAAERNGPGMQRLSHRLKKVQSPIRNQFSRLAMVVNTRASARASNSPRPMYRGQSGTPAGGDSTLPLLPGARRRGPRLRR